MVTGTKFPRFLLRKSSKLPARKFEPATYFSELIHFHYGLLGATCRTARSDGGCLCPHGLPRGLVEAPDLVAHANHEHGLLRVLENIDDPFVLIFQVDRLSVGHEVKIGVRFENFAQ